MLKISCHGGKCCGVKHIHGFVVYPDNETFMEPELDIPRYNSPPYYGALDDLHGSQARPEDNFFAGKAPKERTIERLDRYLKFLDRGRPRQLIEIVLSTTYAEKWAPVLKERGFRLVSKFKNSNTQQTLCVFHRTKEGAPEEK